MNRTIRIVGILLIIIIALIGIFVGFVFAQSNAKLNQTWDVEVISVGLDNVDEAMLAEGERLFMSRGCGDCHGENGGGTIVANNPALGTIAASNLTSGEGGVGQFYEIEDYIRAIQHGVRPDGTGLIIMPSEDWQQMREEELVPLLAYLQSLDPVDNVLPERQPGMLARILLTMGELQLSAEIIDHENAGLVDIESGATAEYGAYLAMGCMGCHGTDFAGGIDVAEPGGPLSANITSHEDGIGNWSLDDFATALRTGVKPDGNVLAEDMPWKSFSFLKDEEIEALYLYLQTTEPVANSE